MCGRRSSIVSSAATNSYFFISVASPRADRLPLSLASYSRLTLKNAGLLLQLLHGATV